MHGKPLNELVSHSSWELQAPKRWAVSHILQLNPTRPITRLNRVLNLQLDKECTQSEDIEREDVHFHKHNWWPSVLVTNARVSPKRSYFLHRKKPPNAGDNVPMFRSLCSKNRLSHAAAVVAVLSICSNCSTARLISSPGLIRDSIAFPGFPRFPPRLDAPVVSHHQISEICV